MKITNRYGRDRDMTAVTMASIGIVLAMLLPIILCFFWLIWRMWCWVLPEIYPTGPDGFINPGFWLFLTAFVLVSIIVRAVFGGRR